MQIAIPERVIERAIQQKYFNVTASANFLGVSPSTFRIWLKNRHIDSLPQSVNRTKAQRKQECTNSFKQHGTV